MRQTIFPWRSFFFVCFCSFLYNVMASSMRSGSSIYNDLFKIVTSGVRLISAYHQYVYSSSHHQKGMGAVQ